MEIPVPIIWDITPIIILAKRAVIPLLLIRQYPF
jgi:hypothetical protein